MLILYQRGEPALCYLAHELAKQRSIECFWPADWVDAARYIVGRAPCDPMSPRPRLRPAWAGIEYYARALRARAASFDTVIFTRPDQAIFLPIFAKQRKIFYAIDDYAAYNRDWMGKEKTLLAAADHVIAVSNALGDELCRRVPAVASRLAILPNAVPAEWFSPPRASAGPAPLPEGLDLPHPLAGLLGTISSRLRLDWLKKSIDETPFLHWLFVGNVDENELLPADRPVLAELQRNKRCTFLGHRPYPVLGQFAKALDVAVMPYSARSVNPMASPMRYYLHLVGGQPILVTPGCFALEEHQPLVKLCPDASALTAALTHLKAQGFDDGLKERRWAEARANTWTHRAEQLISLAGRANAKRPNQTVA